MHSYIPFSIKGFKTRKFLRMHHWIFICLLALVQGISQEEQWESWKIVHQKFYAGHSEETLRHRIWQDNLAKIEDHNRQVGTANFSLGINQFADLTLEEYQESYLSPLLNFNDGNYSGTATHLPPPLARGHNYPDRVDWRQKGFVTAVKNQGTHCKHSSWAFSATAALEGQYYRETGQLVTLSEQQLIDCSGGFGNAGCHGGHMVNAFKYVIENGGICKDSDYNYLGYKWHCMSEYCTDVASCLKYTHVKMGSEVALLDAVYHVGPVSVGVDATNYHFQFYTDGVYAERGCNSHSLNHGMLLVGYGATYDGVEYWIVKNSWGTTWGDRGYMKIARNHQNMCGIATAASYPTIKPSD